MDILSHIHTHGTIFVPYLCSNRRISPGIASIGSPRLYLADWLQWLTRAGSRHALTARRLAFGCLWLLPPSCMCACSLAFFLLSGLHALRCDEWASLAMQAGSRQARASRETNQPLSVFQNNSTNRQIFARQKGISEKLSRQVHKISFSLKYNERSHQGKRRYQIFKKNDVHGSLHSSTTTKSTNTQHNHKLPNATTWLLHMHMITIHEKDVTDSKELRVPEKPKQVSSADHHSIGA